MKLRRIVLSQILLTAALMAGAEAQTATNPPDQSAGMQSAAPRSAMETKADKAHAKELKRQDKYNKKAAKNRVNATKNQEKAAKSRAKADKQRDQSEVDQAKAATNQQKATPQP
jgi:hypothetical protein